MCFRTLSTGGPRGAIGMGLAAMIVGAASIALAVDQPPGQRFEVRPDELPAPYATPVASNPSRTDHTSSGRLSALRRCACQRSRLVPSNNEIGSSWRAASGGSSRMKTL